jgi:hypothetical protein
MLRADERQAGTHSAATGALTASTCVSCSAGSFSSSASSSSCTLCAAGKYSMTSGAMSDSTCSSCPAYANSLSGSDSAEDCTCNAGSSGPNGGTCVLCVAGKYTSQTGSAECIAWPVGTYSTTLGALSSSTCVSCWASSGRYCPSASISPTGSEGPAGYGCLGGTSDKQACSADAGHGSLQSFTGASEAVVIYKIESISSRRHLLAEGIRVETRIMAAGEAAAEEVAGRLAAGSINRELSKAGLPAATVLEAAKPALNSSITLPEPSVSNTGTGAVAAATVASSSSFFSTPVLVGGILGIVFLAGIVAFFCRWKCKNHSMAPSDGPQRLATLEMGTLSTSVNEGLVFHDLEVSSVPRFNEFPGAGESREPLGHDTDQHAGPGQVQTNQAQDKEAEGERQVRRLARTRRRAPAAAAGPESQARHHSRLRWPGAG